jgi:hypothetical protein
LWTVESEFRISASELWTTRPRSRLALARIWSTENCPTAFNSQGITTRNERRTKENLLGHTRMHHPLAKAGLTCTLLHTNCTSTDWLSPEVRSTPSPPRLGGQAVSSIHLEGIQEQRDADKHGTTLHTRDSCPMTVGSLAASSWMMAWGNDRHRGHFSKQRWLHENIAAWIDCPSTSKNGPDVVATSSTRRLRNTLGPEVHDYLPQWRRNPSVPRAMHVLRASGGCSGFLSAPTHNLHKSRCFPT